MSYYETGAFQHGQDFQGRPLSFYSETRVNGRCFSCPDEALQTAIEMEASARKMNGEAQVAMLHRAEQVFNHAVKMATPKEEGVK